MSGDGFISRWSRRKQASSRKVLREEARGETAAEPRQRVVVEAVEPHPHVGIMQEEIAALPPVEGITDPTQLARYLRKGVPTVLRNAAMRRMWMLDPAIRDYIDPALDYAYDWNIPGGVPGNGALAAGFDARGAGEGFLSSLRGEISRESGESGEANSVNDGGPADANGGGSSRIAASKPTDVSQSKVVEDRIAKDSDEKKSSDTLVEVSDVAMPKTKRKTHEKEGLSRRHGRALPV